MTSCKGCGREIVWAEDDKGTKIPLDPRAPVYQVVDGVAVRNTKAMVSHFATCSQANRFSGSRRRG